MTNESTYGMGKHTPAATTPGEWMKEAERLAHEMQRKYHHAMQMQALADKDEKECTLAENLQRAGIANAAWLNYHRVRAEHFAHLQLRADTPAAPDMSSGADERAKFEAWVRNHKKPEQGWWTRQIDDGGYSSGLADAAWEGWQAALSAPATPPTNPWKEAVIDQLALTCMDASLDEPPSSILKRVIDWNVMVALDPSVSEAAAALVASGATPPAKQQVGGQFDVVDHFTPPASEPDQFTAGVNAAAAMLDKKADAYAHEHSTQDSDTGVWEFGRHGEDYYNTLRELADDVRSIVRGDPAPEGPAVGDLVLLVNRLAHSLKKANPDSDLPAKAADYLQRHTLSSPLRAIPPAQPAPATPSAKLEEAERLIKAVADTSFACGEYDPPDADDQQWNEGYTNLRNSNEEAKDALINFIAPLLDRSADGGEAVAPASFEEKADEVAQELLRDVIFSYRMTSPAGKDALAAPILEAMQWAAQRGTVKVRMLTVPELFSHPDDAKYIGQIGLNVQESLLRRLRSDNPHIVFEEVK